jgi:hypothetical protein
MRSRRRRISTWLSSSLGLRPHRRLTSCSCRKKATRARPKCRPNPNRETCLLSGPSQRPPSNPPSPSRPSPRSVRPSCAPTSSRKRTLTVRSPSWSANWASLPTTASVADSTKSWRRRASVRASCSSSMASSRKSRASLNTNPRTTSSVMVRASKKANLWAMSPVSRKGSATS